MKQTREIWIITLHDGKIDEARNNKPGWID
jgi:hypothetical protein